MLFLILGTFAFLILIISVANTYQQSPREVLVRFFKTIILLIFGFAAFIIWNTYS